MHLSFSLSPFLSITHPDEGAHVESDHRGRPLGCVANPQFLLALGADDHQVQPDDVRGVDLLSRKRRCGEGNGKGDPFLEYLQRVISLFTTMQIACVQQ